MSVATAPATLDVSHTPAVPFGRLVRVELRKLADTRAGRWLLISIAALTVLVLIIQMAVVLGQDLHPKFLDFLQGMNTPMGVLLPVLGVMSVTSEWSQRTAMVTFTLEPSRVRVVAAKFVSILLISALALVIGLVLGSLANVMYGAFSGHEVVWGSVGKYAVYYLMLYVFGMATGFAFAAALMDWFKSLQPWIDFNTDQNNLIDATIHGKDWAQLVVSGFIWLVVPLAIGIWRIRRAEVK
jgi:ABC-type transport system involved in multi-copper enzyme maturation permease subunit